MNYENGPHIITARKSFNCEYCNEMIKPKESYFARVKVIVKDKEKEYKRYHLCCASNLEDLNEEESEMVVKSIEQDTLSQVIGRELAKYEYQGKLISFPYNIQPTKNFIVSLKEGLMFILLLTSDKNKEMPLWLKTKLDFMKTVTYNVHNISSIEDFEAVMQRYIS